MRIIALIFGYKPWDETKDVLIVTLDKPELANYVCPIPILKLKNRSDIVNVIKKDDIVFIHSLSLTFGELSSIKNLGCKVIFKLDNDGRLGRWKNPKPRFYFLRSSGKPYWKIPIRFLNVLTPLGLIYERQEIRKFEIVDKILIESYPALSNLAFFAYQYNKIEIMKKVNMIPDPVTFDISNAKIPEKENFVISIGRWDDKTQKNPKILVQSLEKFLDAKKNWKTYIIGSGESIIKNYMRKLPNDIKERIAIIGPIDHQKIKDYLLKSKIFFMPSRYESFGIAAAEALCCGCSVVSTPIEPLVYMVGGGFNGLNSSSFKAQNLSSALLIESELWERQTRDPYEISQFWREQLNLEKIISQFTQIINSTVISKDDN